MLFGVVAFKAKTHQVFLAQKAAEKDTDRSSERCEKAGSVHSRPQNNIWKLETGLRLSVSFSFPAWKGNN